AARYQSAAEMAEDLQRVIEDRPILARRASATERLWRWSRRNPWVAGLTAASALLLVLLSAALGVAALSYRSRATTEENAKQAIAEKQGKLEAEQKKLVDERNSVREANSLLDSAARNQVNKEWKKALADYDAAVALQPDNAQVWAARGQLQ